MYGNGDLQAGNRQVRDVPNIGKALPTLAKYTRPGLSQLLIVRTSPTPAKRGALTQRCSAPFFRAPVVEQQPNSNQVYSVEGAYKIAVSLHRHRVSQEDAERIREAEKNKP